MAAEQTLTTAAQALAATSRDVAIARPASERLDEQQRRAYDYAIASDARLKVVTGVPGAGKTTLITEVAAAYRDAGYNVRAVSIANSAVDVLRRETDVPARSIAKSSTSGRKSASASARVTCSSSTKSRRSARSKARNS